MQEEFKAYPINDGEKCVPGQESGVSKSLLEGNSRTSSGDLEVILMAGGRGRRQARGWGDRSGQSRTALSCAGVNGEPHGVIK